MRKINSKGFTLIELLAVITIMGILLLVAIPAISKLIENSRKDAFVNISAKYIDAVRNSVMSDSIECIPAGGGDKLIASALPAGTYNLRIDTTTEETQSLVEKGGKSPFGGAPLYGYVVFSIDPESNKSAEYYIALTDSSNHGYLELYKEGSLRRANVKTATGGNFKQDLLSKIELSGSDFSALASLADNRCSVIN